MKNPTRAALLASLLAQVDALFVPIRSFTTGRNAAAYLGRLKYQRAGIDWHSRARTDRRRKQAQRELEQMAAEGLVTLSKGNVKTLGVRLTDRAEREGRALVGVGGECSSFCLMQELAERSKRDPVEYLDMFVPETALAGYKWGDDSADALNEFRVITNMLLWAMVRGYVVSRSSCQGHVYYALTSSGWAKLESGWAPPDDPTDYNFDAADLYEVRLRDALERLNAAEQSQELGPLPVPVAMAGLALRPTRPQAREEALPC